MTVRLHCHSFTCINFIRDEFLWFLNKTLNFTTFFVTDHTILRGFLHFCYHYSAFLKTMKIYIKYNSTNIKDISTLKLYKLLQTVIAINGPGHICIVCLFKCF